MFYLETNVFYLEKDILKVRDTILALYEIHIHETLIINRSNISYWYSLYIEHIKSSYSLHLFIKNDYILDIILK